MKNIKAIIFDFGGVILDIDFDRCARSFEHLGVKDFKKMYSQTNADPLFQHFEEGKNTENEFYDKLRKITAITADEDQIRDAWNSLLIRYRKKALITLNELRPRYKLFMLSNTNIAHCEKFRIMYQEEIGKGNIEDHFDKVYYSHEIGFRKPDRKAYEFVLKQNHLDPSGVLFIDDSVQNIPPAKELGMEAILLKKGTGIEDLGLTGLTD